MFVFLIRLFSDLIRIHKSDNGKGKGFAFIVHPRGYGDILANLPFLKIFSRNLVIRLFPKLWPFTVSRISGLRTIGSNEELEGWVIGIPMLAHQIMENRNLARKKISQAIKLSKQLGAKTVGLGALTGSVTEGGAGLSRKNEISVTAGRAYTTYVIKSYIEDVVKRFKLQKEVITIAIVGAAGGVGRGLIRILIDEPYLEIILIDLERKLESIRNSLTEKQASHIKISHQIRTVRNADIIVTVTNSPEAVVQSDDVKPGTIIIDDAQPSDLSKELLKTRDDVIVIEAGVITAKNINVGANFRLANKNETYCCLGEVMAIAASDWVGEYSPGEVTPETVNQIANIAKKLGFKLAPYQAYGTLVEKGKIKEVRNLVRLRT